MFGTLKKARLTPSEFAVIVGVSRVTVYNWKAGRSSPHSLLDGRVELAVKLIEGLLTRNKLPLADDLTSAARRVKVAKLRSLLKSIRA